MKHPHITVQLRPEYLEQLEEGCVLHAWQRSNGKPMTSRLMRALLDEVWPLLAEVEFDPNAVGGLVAMAVKISTQRSQSLLDEYEAHSESAGGIA